MIIIFLKEIFRIRDTACTAGIRYQHDILIPNGCRIQIIIKTFLHRLFKAWSADSR